MTRFFTFLLILFGMFSCAAPDKPAQNPDWKFDQKILSSLGTKHKNEWSGLADHYASQVKSDSSNVQAMLGFAEAKVIMHIFGWVPREPAITQAKEALQLAQSIDPSGAETLKISGILHFLDWNWDASQTDFLKSISLRPDDNSTRHWYCLWLSAMGRFDEAMAHSDTVMTNDTEGNMMVARGSMYYFTRQNETMRDYMLKAVAQKPNEAWGYDWLGMAYIELEDFENSINTYFKAFELADGTVEVGAGLGHALGLAGEKKLAKEMADYYVEAAKDRYLPYCQRAFVHIGIEEYDEALTLLETAYAEKSWFLIFMDIEPWYDPVRSDARFQAIVDKMDYPSNRD